MIHLENIIALWFVTLPKTGDYLAALLRNKDGGCELKLRLREYCQGPDGKGPGRCSCEDTKHWYHVKQGNFTEEQMIESARSVALSIQKQYGGEYCERHRKGLSVEDFVEVLNELPYFTVKKVQIRGATIH